MRFNDQLDLKTRTKRWYISSPTGVVGVIKWNGAWRRYCFYPYPDTVFDSDGLLVIEDFMLKNKNTRNG